MIKAHSGIKRREARTALFFILPFLAFFVFFKLYPMVYGFLVSFLDQNSARKVSRVVFVGFDNYLKIIGSVEIMAAFWRTLQFSLIYTVMTMVAALFMAVMFNKNFRGQVACRTIFYLPYVTNIIAVSIVWRYLLHPFSGPVNALFRVFSVPREALPRWLSGTYSALPTTALIASWAALAFPLITILAALQDCPKDLIEAAELDGAGRFQQFFHVTLPALTPVLFMLLTITIINSLRNFSVIAGLTAGGPGIATMVASYQIYNDAFVYMKFSIAAAEGVILTILVLVINTAVTWGRNRWTD